MTKVTTSFTTKGPFFAADPVQTLAHNITRMVDAVAIEGANEVRAALRSDEGGRYRISHGVKPGRVSSHVEGRVHSLTGTPWHRWAVVGIANRDMTAEQATALMAASAVVEGQTRAFAKVQGRISRSRKVNVGELTKGLA